MKLSAFTLTLALCAPAMAQDYLAVLSPYGDKAQMKAQVSMVQKQLATMDAGDKLSILNGEDGLTITDFTIPNVPKAYRVRAIQGYNKQAIAALHQFVAKAMNTRKAGTLNLPYVLGQVALYHREAQDIVLLGSLSFDVPEVTPSIASGALLPADSNLRQSTGETIFGTRDIAERLKGFRIHWWQSHLSSSTQYQQDAMRFWHLWLHNQGAEVISISRDKSVVLKRLADKAPALPMTYRLREENTQAALPSTLFERPLNQRVDIAQWQPVQKISVAIRWIGENVDLDIYSLLPHQNNPVYFANSHTALATHLKDVRSAPSSSGGKSAFYETIIYHKPIDGCQLLVGVNFYSGKVTREVSGHIRIAMGDAVFERPFTLPTKTGNQGADIINALTARRSSAHSLVLSLSDMTGDVLAQRCHA